MTDTPAREWAEKAGPVVERLGKVDLDLGLAAHLGIRHDDLSRAATLLATALTAYPAAEAEVAELTLALAEADRKNDAMHSEWNAAEAERDALAAELGEKLKAAFLDGFWTGPDGPEHIIENAGGAWRESATYLEATGQGDACCEK